VASWAARPRPAETLQDLARRAGEDRADVYGFGGAVERLERRVADLLRKEAALLLPSGTTAQQIALRIHCERRGIPNVAFHPQCHLEAHEEKGYERLHRLHAILEPVGALLLELPQRDLGGQLPSWDDLVAQLEWARSRGAATHMDGARLWQCEPFYGKTFAETSALFDTVYVSLYKDLEGIGGCLLAGPDHVIAEARVWAIRHGGRVASLYPYALSGERGLDEVLPRMPSYVEAAREIGAALAAVDGIDVVPDPPQVAMLHVYVRGDLERVLDAVAAIAEERRVLLGRFGPTQVPGVQRTEIQVGAPTLEIAPGEVAELYADVVARAAG